jgi:hypothetical protein
MHSGPAEEASVFGTDPAFSKPSAHVLQVLPSELHGSAEAQQTNLIATATGTPDTLCSNDTHAYLLRCEVHLVHTAPRVEYVPPVQRTQFSVRRPIKFS